MLKCEKCGGIIEDNKIFYDIHDKFYCDCCVEDNKGIFVVKDTQISVDTTHKFFIKNQARKFKSFDECIRNLEKEKQKKLPKEKLSFGKRKLKKRKNF